MEVVKLSALRTGTNRNRERERERMREGGENSQREENARYVTEIAICSDSQ
jgi:hypothetical protein